jgi:uncharacterized protein (DUF1697 family)
MDHLRNLFVSMGFANVETLIASGNVIFDSKSRVPSALEQKIEKRLREALGYEVTTFIRTVPEVAEVVCYPCFAGSELEKPGNILYVGFMSKVPASAGKKKLALLADKVNDFCVHEREVYWLRRTGVGESEYSGGLIEKTLGVPVTFRNSTTVRKIVAKYLRE